MLPSMQQMDDIPSDIKSFLSASVAAAARVAQSLPATGPQAWRATTYRLVLGAILRDWSENGTAELVDEDVQNLTSFVELASATASQPDLPDQDVTFEVILNGLLDDWVENWFGSAEEDEHEDEEEEEDEE